MTTRLRYHVLFWGLAFAAFIGFVALFKSVLLPFVVGAAVAYLLNPMVNAMGKMRIGRKPAAFMILGGFFLLVFIALAVISPLLYKQLLQFSKDLPTYIEQIAQWAEPYVERVLAVIGQDEEVDVTSFVKEYGQSLFSVSGGAALSVAGGLAAGGAAVLDVISLLVFMPLVAYFLIIEWPAITKRVEGLMPRDHKETILDLLSQINKKVAGFVRGQITVAVLLGVIYAIALSILGLRYGFLIGLVSGLLSIIPMVGSIVGLVVSVLVAWLQSGELSFVAMVGGVFIAGQILEGNFITPKLVGDSVGLHPLWIFFALLAGGSLFGILGMFLAVPVAAVAGVLLTFALNLYRGSVYFKGRHGGEKGQDEGAGKRPAKAKKA